MRVAVVAPYAVAPPLTGGAYRSYHTALLLSRVVDGSVTVLCAAREDGRWRLPGGIRCRAFGRRRRDAAALLGDRTRGILARYARGALRRHLERGGYDLVVCEHLFSRINLPSLAVPVVVNLHNVEAVNAGALLAARGVPGPVARRLASAVAAAEARLVGEADLAWTVTAGDRRRILATALPRGGAGACQVLPHPADFSRFASGGTAKAAGARRTVLFTGHLDWPFNREALGWFADAVAPRLAGTSLRLLVAGRTRRPRSLEPLLARIDRHLPVETAFNFTGAEAVFRRAGVLVSPARSGTGSLVKNLVAFCHRTPVLATTSGARGYGAMREHGLRVLDDPRGWPDALAELVDPARRSALGADLFAGARRHYGLEALSRTVAGPLRALALARPRRPRASTARETHSDR